MKGKMAKAGYTQGDMSPKIDDFQKPMDCFPESGFSKTTEYVERQDKFQHEMSKDIKKQQYKGRYS
jgi:hypothetical protein